MTKLVEQEIATEPTPEAALSESTALILMIERAARDPNVDINKMERLFEMHERILSRNAKVEYLAALSEMQPKLPIITKRGAINIDAKNAKGEKTGTQQKMTSYAKWEDEIEGITPILAEHGFSLSFRFSYPAPDRILTTGVLGHRGGHSEETAISLPIDTSGAKNNVQGWGSTTSYGKRYTSSALLNYVSRDEDDDGKQGGDEATVSELQIKALQSKIKEVGANIDAFLRYGGVASLSDILAKDYDLAMSRLSAKTKVQA